MATITITFANKVNTSLQALSNTASRDNVYFKDTANNIHFQVQLDKRLQLVILYFLEKTIRLIVRLY